MLPLDLFLGDPKTNLEAPNSDARSRTFERCSNNFFLCCEELKMFSLNYTFCLIHTFLESTGSHEQWDVTNIPSTFTSVNAGLGLKPSPGARIGLKVAILVLLHFSLKI